ncbi:hypothetical protein V8C40DRAFT_187428 [Trichoderma camerunense]
MQLPPSVFLFVLCSYCYPLVPSSIPSVPAKQGCNTVPVLVLSSPAAPWYLYLHHPVSDGAVYSSHVLPGTCNPLGAPCSCMLHSLSLARHQQSYRTRTGSSTACPSMKDCMYMLPLGMPVPVHARGHPLKTPHPLLPPAKSPMPRVFFLFFALGHRLTLSKLPLFLGKEEKIIPSSPTSSASRAVVVRVPPGCCNPSLSPNAAA